MLIPCIFKPGMSTLNSKPGWMSLAFRALASALMLSAGWPPLPLTFLLFLAWVPLLQAIDSLLTAQESRRVFRSIWLLVYGCFLVWNGLTTWWVAKATLGGGVFAIVVNSALMTLPVMVYAAARRYLGTMAGYLTLLSGWLTFEYLHMRWEFTWPWLTLGNGLAEHPAWIQWYDQTGVLGGSLWILLVNLFVYRELRRFAAYALGVSSRYQMQPAQRNALALLLATLRPALVVLVPLLLSLILYQRRDPARGKAVQVALLQTNYNPHTEKFDLPPDQLLEEMIAQSLPALEQDPDYLVWPETALTNNIDLATLERHPSTRKLRDMLEAHPETELIVGINGYERFDSEAEAPAEARSFDYAGGRKLWIAGYNTAMQIGAQSPAQIYNKGILVPGPEAWPYKKQLRWLNQVVPGLENYMGSLSRSPSRGTFWREDAEGDRLGVAPAICYESIFGEYVTGWTNGGSELLFVITNDGWWGNTAGRQQHLAYARLRAIENRRCVARSANTGVSCFIDQRGDVVADAGFDRADVLQGTMYANDEVTPYMRQGDLLGRTAGWVVAGLVLLTLVSRLTGRFALR